MTRTPMERMQGARTALLLSHPFFGYLALRLRLVEDPVEPTAWVDGVILGFNPVFVGALSEAELCGLVCHEVLHCALGHCWRRGQREERRWGHACDYVVNDIVLTSGFSLPDGRLHDPKFASKSAEEVYELLGKEWSGGCADLRSCGALRESPAARRDELQGAWTSALVSAMHAARQAGKLPAALEELVQERISPRVNWRAVLWNFVQSVANDDYSYRQPRRSFLPLGLYMPMAASASIGNVVVIVDTSGSIHGRLLAQFLSELEAIATSIPMQELIVVECDAEVHRVSRYSPGDPIQQSFVGRGGTSFVPSLLYAGTHYPDASCIVYLTDLEGVFPEHGPNSPLLWVCTSNNIVPPFGEVVHIPEAQDRAA